MQNSEDEKISTVQKGDALEDAFYKYLIEQKKSGRLIDGLYKPELCKIYKKKSYYCAERGAYVTFDVVVEVARENVEGPALFIIFECKNYKGNLPEDKVTDFSDKLQRLFKHNAKGALVCGSKLQSGALNLVKKRGLGLIKYDQHGFEYIVQRQAKNLIDASYIQNSIFQSLTDYKSMKFSAYCDGAYYGSFSSFVEGVLKDNTSSTVNKSPSLPYISQEDMEVLTADLLSEISYLDGAVNLIRICDKLSLKLEYIEEPCFDSDRNEVLGEADFEARCIKIYPHSIKNRERFTIAHEIGHFYLGHSDFLGSESVVEKDLFIGEPSHEVNFYRNMEFQANSFASCLLLPKDVLLKRIYEVKKQYDIPLNRYVVYVDNQPCNIKDYMILMDELVSSFEATQTAIEVRLKKLDFLTDSRQGLKKFREMDRYANLNRQHGDF